MVSIRADQVFLQRINRITVLQHIRREGPISRIDLSRRTGLSPSTITNITRYLLSKGLISERKSQVTGGRGRRPVWLNFNPDGGRLIGLDIQAGLLSGAVTDLGGEVRHVQERPVEDPGDSSRVMEQAKDLLRSLEAKAGRRRCPLYGVGVSFPGVVDPKTGDCLFWAESGWKRVPLGRSLKDAVGVPVLLEEDVRAEALGEFWFGAGQGVSNLVLLKLDRGVGAGVVLEQRLYRGTNGLAGEIGHITVDPHGRRCSCGRIGCLETKASAPAVLERLREVLKEHPNSPLAREELSLEAFYRVARESDKAAGEVLKQLIAFTKVALEMVVHAYDPDMIVLSGAVVEAEGADILLQSVQLGDFPVEVGVDVKVSSFGKQRGIIGAAALVLHRLIIDPQAIEAD